MEYTYLFVNYDNWDLMYEDVRSLIYKIKDQEELNFLLENYFAYKLSDWEYKSGRKYFMFTPDTPKDKLPNLITHLGLWHKLPFQEKGFSFVTCFLSKTKY